MTTALNNLFGKGKSTLTGDVEFWHGAERTGWLMKQGGILSTSCLPANLFTHAAASAHGSTQCVQLAALFCALMTCWGPQYAFLGSYRRVHQDMAAQVGHRLFPVAPWCRPCMWVHERACLDKAWSSNWLSLALQVVCAEAGKDLLVQVRHCHTGETSLCPQIKRHASVFCHMCPQPCCGIRKPSNQIRVCIPVCNCAGLHSPWRY